MYWILMIFGLVLLWCVGAIVVLLVRAKRAKVCRTGILVRLNELEYAKAQILTVEEMEEKRKKRYLEDRKQRFEEIRELGARQGETYVFNPATGGIHKVGKKEDGDDQMDRVDRTD